MGSFNATCIVSNLQIEAGDKVRFLALTKNAHHKDNEYICYVSGRWQVRCPPIKAEYNDYGAIENWEKSITTNLFFKSFDTDVIEKGVGDNQCHDVRVRHKMSNEDWINALYEGRVEVVDDYYLKSDKSLTVKDEHVKAGFPTIRRIEKIITDAGFKNTIDYGDKGYVVDDVVYGFVRVRYGRNLNNSAALKKILPFIHKAGYAAMITCGSGYYSNYSEILIAPGPGVDEKGHNHSTFGLTGNKDYYKPRPVSLAMIREDVWQILLSTPIKIYSSEVNFSKIKEDTIKAVNDALNKKAEIEELKKDSSKDNSLLIFRLLGDDWNYDNKNLFLSFIHPHEGELGFTLKRAFQFACEQENLSKEDLIQYAIDIAETAYVQCVYAHLHGQWHPTTNSGQDGNWEEHRDFLQKLSEIKGRYENDE